MPVLNQVNAPDTYDGKNAIMSNVFGARGGWFSVLANDAFVELQYSKKNQQGQEDWTQEIRVGDGAFASLPPNCIGVQFRNALAGNPAIITAQIATGDEPALSISALGNVSATVLLSQIPRVNVLPATPTDQQVCSYLVPGFSNTIEWLVIWNAATGFWDIIGGPPLVSGLQGSMVLNAGGQTNLTAGPSITIPNKGDYEIAFGVEVNAGAGQTEATIGINGSILGLLFNQALFPPGSAAFWQIVAYEQTYFNAAIQSFNITCAIANSTVATAFQNGFIRMMPRRIQA